MKNSLKYFLPFVVLFGIWNQFRAQNIDSLQWALKVAKQDTTRCTILFAIIEAINDDNIWPKYNEEVYRIAEKLVQSNNPIIKTIGKKNVAAALNNFGFLYNNQGDSRKALTYYNKSLALQEEIGDKKGIATSLNNIGAIYSNNGDIDKSLECYEKSFNQYSEINDKIGIAQSLNNIGSIYNNKGDISRALDYLNKSLKIREEIGNKDGTAETLINIGSIYENQEDLSKALECYIRSLKLYEEIENKIGLAAAINNIAVVYRRYGDYTKCLEYFEKNLKIYTDLGHKNGIATSLNNLGTIYAHQKNYTKALGYYEQCLKIQREVGDKESMSSLLINISGVYLNLASDIPNQKEKYLSLAFSYCDTSLSISKELGFPENIRNAEHELSEIELKKGNYEGAFSHYKQFIIFKDSISNESTRKASIKNQLKYEYEKKEAVIKEQQEKERAIADEKNRFQKIVIVSVITGLILVLIFAAFVFRSLKTTRKQKLIIEEKQKEILDSIHYAKRIQTALMTNENYIDKNINRLQKKG